ncbi:hypothetical protein [Capnocytophaga cynodegmi]|uniref:hypothetical protein n=1 Tax=Capnocytophaga cynodegmi TaxID=28189 RepID=UPI001EE1BA72|nr:hypothetical protein [Capnocytophaga cynodegmi]GJQ08163.1 hypothetical protein CAPN010_23210 [Capnocytophaga cynodegmi]
MKKVMFIVASLLLVGCKSWVRIGDLTAISNRNVDGSKTYVLLSRDVEATASSNTNDALEQAVDNLTKKYEGEFIRNAKVYVRDDGKKVRVVGDVWGEQNMNVNVTTSATANVELNIGDSVVFRKKKGGKLIDGKVIGFNSGKCVVEYNKGKKIELSYDEVTKTNK